MSSHRPDSEQPQTTMSDEKKLSTTLPTDAIEPAGSTFMAEATAEAAFAGYEVGFLNLALIYIGIEMALFMTLMESTVVSTSVVAITNDLSGYVKSSWLFTSYMLTFSGFPIVWAKASDIAGRKPCLLAAMIIFLAFSAACGAAQSFIQLITFRWLQGIGGAGVFSLTLVFYELIPPSKYALSTGVTNVVVSLSFLSGPLIGGAITRNGKWRWVFLMNIPIIASACIVILLVFPKKLSREPIANRANESITRRLRRVDVLGATMLLGVTVPLVTALPQASQSYTFSSAFVWPLLVVSALFLVGFLAWQWYVTTKRSVPEPVLPWRFLAHRISVGIMLNTFLSGCVMTVCTVQIPQRFIVLYNMSTLNAGIRLLAFSLMVPVGSIFAAILLDKKIVTLNALLLIGGVLETIGVALYAKLTSDISQIARQYGFQIVIGTGLGFVSTATFLLVPTKMEKRDLAVGTGMVAQFRILGGVIALSIVTCASTPLIREALLQTLSPEQTHAILEKLEIIHHLSEHIQVHVRESFHRGFDLQMEIIVGFAAAHIPATLMMMTKEPITSKLGLRKNDNLATRN